MSEIHIVAFLYPRKGHESRVTELFKQMCADVLTTEPGASRYLTTTALDTEDPTIIMIETYKDQKSADQHAQTQHFKELFATFAKEDLMAKEARIFKTKSCAGFDLDRQLL